MVESVFLIAFLDRLWATQVEGVVVVMLVQPLALHLMEVVMEEQIILLAPLAQLIVVGVVVVLVPIMARAATVVQA
jgi:hypothetical protein